MRFFVKTLTGKTITVEAEEDWTVADVKDQICLEEGVLFAQQKLIVGGKLLEDSTELAELEIMEDSTVDLVVTLCGGATSTMDPAIVELSKKYNHDKKICRKCYATLPPRAEKCRKRSCGHWPDIRFRKTIKGGGK
jgi:ribosomal protein L40E